MGKCKEQPKGEKNGQIKINNRDLTPYPYNDTSYGIMNKNAFPDSVSQAKTDGEGIANVRELTVVWLWAKNRRASQGGPRRNCRDPLL